MAKPYDWLINYINTNIPFLGEPIKVFGEGFTFTTTEIIIPIVFLFIINLFGNLVRSILINKILSRYVEDRKNRVVHR